MAWSAANRRSIEDALARHWPGCAFELVDEIASTNTELMERAREGRLSPVLLAARRQTAGRGRLGRVWESLPADAHGGAQAADPEGASSLTFSLGLSYAPADWSGLSLAIGASIAASLDPGPASRLRLKWPNDLLLDGRKLAGILVETAASRRGEAAADASIAPARQVVIGIGLNLGPRPADGLRTPPAWWREVEPGAAADEVLARLIGPLLADLRRFALAGFGGFRDDYARRDALQGRPVELSDGRAGTACGVDRDGALLVSMAHGVERISSAEVSARPRRETA